MEEPDGGIPPSKVNSILKYCLLAFTMFFWLAGGCFVGIGTWSVLQKTGYDELSDFATDPAIVIIAVGTLIFLINFCGCIGALRENVFLLEVYKFCLIAVLIIEVVGALLAFAFWPEVKKLIDDKVQVAVQKYTSKPDLRNLIDKIQYEFECCGSTGTDDWDKNEYFSCTSPTFQSCGVPWSCCLRKFQQNKQCGYGVRRDRLRLLQASLIHINGCLDTVVQYFRRNLMAVAGIGIGFAFPLIMGIIMSHILANQVRDQIASWDQPKTFL